MGEVLAPQTPDDLAATIRRAIAEQMPLEVMGSGTKRALGRPMQTGAILDLSRFRGITLYEPEELVIAAGAATPMSEIEAALAEQGQELAFEPPDLSRLLGAADAGTLGGMLACNLSGPRRLKAGAARDHVLGIEGVSGRGEPFKAGGRVVKNVTGYDLAKLMTGSWGTLAALTGITLKVLPSAEHEETLLVPGQSPGEAIQSMSLAMQSPCEVSGAAYLPEDVAGSCGLDHAATLLRLEGIAPSVAYRRDKLMALLSPSGRCDVLPVEPSRRLWRALRDLHPLCDEPERHLWRISVPPSEGARLATALPGARYYLDWAGGLVWLALTPAADAGAAALRSLIREGHATLIRAPGNIRAAVPVFQPQPEALAALTARVKQAFDPAAILNPGRMYAGV
jgi:glycolate oxidase FAD binding subunit